MNYTVKDEGAWLLSLQPQDRARFLAFLSHNLTVAMRALCHGAGEPTLCLERVRVLNEAHHRVSSYLAHFHEGDEDSSWTEVVVEFTLAVADPVVHQQSVLAWHYAKAAILNQGST